MKLFPTYYDDMQGVITTAGIPPANAPDIVYWDHGIGSGVTFPVYAFDTGEYVYLTFQTFHSTELSTVIDNHIHYSTPTDGTGDRFQFQLDVIAAPIGGTWAVPTGSPFTKEVTISTDDSDSHRLVDIADIPGVNTTVSTLYKVKLQRIAATVDEYAGDVYVHINDCHWQGDTLGSEAETSKEA